MSEAGRRQAVDGHFGLLPHLAKELSFGRRTFSAQSETVATAPNVRDAWRRGQRCIVPAKAIFEPSYETGQAVRWRIWQPGEVPMGIAGIGTSWRDPADREERLSFAMLTVNAAGPRRNWALQDGQPHARLCVAPEPLRRGYVPSKAPASGDSGARIAHVDAVRFQ